LFFVHHGPSIQEWAQQPGAAAWQLESTYIAGNEQKIKK
jgi:hypothetical protein